MLASFILTGCATSKTNGTLSRSEEITNTFENSTVVPDHTYYYTGPEAQPDAIIGIGNSYTLQQSDKKFWVKVDISEKILQDWNLIIDNDTRSKSSYYGSGIMTPDGKQVGIWYSKYRYTVVKFPAANTVVIYTPDTSSKGTIQKSARGSGL